MIDVLLFSPSLPPVVGGVETFLGTLARGLAERGARVHLLCGNQPDAAIRLAVEGTGGRVHVPLFDTPAEAIPWEHGTFASAAALHEFLEATPVEVIHASSHDTALAAAMVLPGHPDVAALTAFGEMATETTRFGRLRSEFVHGLERIDCFLAWSEYYRHVAITHGSPPDKVRVVLAGVDVKNFAAGDRARGRAQLGIEEDTFLFCCPSRFSPRKGQLELARAMRETGDLSFDLLLTGSLSSGSAYYYSEVMEELDVADARDRVHVRLDAPAEDMPDLMAAADVIVQPSHAEGLGGSALEAMSAGVPVLLTHTHGFDEIAEDGRTALMVPPRDAGALAQGLRRLHGDEELRARLSAAGREHATAHFSADRTIDELLALYLELREARRG